MLKLISVVYPYLFLTTNENDLSKITSAPPPTVSKMNVLSYDQAAFIVIENLNRRVQIAEIIDHDNVIFIGTKVQDEKFFR